MSQTSQDGRMDKEGRALLTKSEREVLTGTSEEQNTNYTYKVRSLVRNRVRKQFGRDMEILEENFEEVFEMIQEEVCDRE